MTATLTRDAVDVVLADLFADRIQRAEPRGEHYAQLWRRLEVASSGGKRLRPRLLLDTHQAFGAPYPEDATTAAAAFELLHTALLLHDDVIDRDLSRRGRPTVSAEFAADANQAGLSPNTASAWGDASAILGGDLLLSAAHALIAQVRPAVRTKLADIIDESLFRAAAGEHDDVAFGLGTALATPEHVVRMMENKTAGYSFAAPLRAGAALAQAGEQASTELDRVGNALGVLYQLRDDLLGVFGDTHRTGKSTTGDLRQGKRTLLITFAEGEPAWTAVHHLWGDPQLDETGAERLRAALVTSGARDATVDLIDRMRRATITTIGETTLPPGLQQQLVALTDTLAGRES